MCVCVCVSDGRCFLLHVHFGMALVFLGFAFFQRDGVSIQYDEVIIGDLVINCLSGIGKCLLQITDKGGGVLTEADFLAEV